MALQLGPVIGQVGGVEVFEPTFTPNSTSIRATLATQVVGEGQWLIAVRAKRGISLPSIWINNVLALGGNGNDAPISTASVVTGPVTITMEGVSINSGHVYIVRIG